MVTTTILCPACQSDKVIKFGKTLENKQRYCCKEMSCQKNTFLWDYTYNGRLPGIKEKIIDMALNGSGVRDTVRVLKVSINTVISTLKKKRAS